MADKQDVKNTLNLPQTTFSMKAALAQKEPEMIPKWQAMGLYEKILEKRAGRPPFVLHDGPPYANGHIHLGTALNKILKDFIVKTKSMQGFLAPYVPGWDCHGLPIEIHVDKLLGDKKKDMSIIEIRDECRKYAQKFIDIQREEFIRLGVLGEWNEPYLTMNPGYEGEVLRHLAAFFAVGERLQGEEARPLVRPLQDRPGRGGDRIQGSQIAVGLCQVSDGFRDWPKNSPPSRGRKVSVIIWTTTPWTLPANLAIAFHPESEYVAAEVGRRGLHPGQAAPAHRRRRAGFRGVQDSGRIPWPRARRAQGQASLDRPGIGFRPGGLCDARGRHGLRPHGARARP